MQAFISMTRLQPRVALFAWISRLTYSIYLLLILDLSITLQAKRGVSVSFWEFFLKVDSEFAWLIWEFLEFLVLLVADEI